MSILLDVPAYLIMAFSMVLGAPDEKASRVQTLTPVSPTAASPARSYRVPEDEWLRAVKAASPRSDILRVYANRIFVTSAGRHYVASESDRDEIAALSRNAAIVEHVMTAGLLELKACLTKKSGKLPARSTLLVAHYYGCELAYRYSRAVDDNPFGLVGEALPHFRLVENPRATLALADAQLQRAASGNAAVTRRRNAVADQGRDNGKPGHLADGKAPIKGSIAAVEKPPLRNLVSAAK